MLCCDFGGPDPRQRAPGRGLRQQLNGGQVVALLQNPAAQTHSLLRGFQTAGGGDSLAVQGDARGGSEPGFAPVQGGFRLPFRVIREQRHLQLFHGVTVVMTDECQVHSGSSADVQHPLDFVTTDDICQFGMIPEFVGRFPVMTHTEPLTEKDLVRILTEPQNAITKQYQELLRLDNTILRFSPEVLKNIARRALKMKTGARALRGIMDQLMMDIMYSAPDNRTAKKPVVVQVDTNNPLINNIAV